MFHMKSLSLNIKQYDKKKQIKHGVIQKVCHLHNDIFHPIQLCHTLSILLYHFPCVIHEASLRNYRMRKYDF